MTHTETPTPATCGSVTVRLGRPVQAQALRYVELYDGKPFAEAVLLYFDNGAYEIWSEGEEHFGSWVSATPIAEVPREVVFLSWPSADWGGDVAWHTLVFVPASGAFSQVLRLPGRPAPLTQFGYSALLPEPATIDPSTPWTDLRERFAETFDELARRAG